jgi:4-diphosphocytidyl-2-C-methyl-D-erythritol kinase
MVRGAGERLGPALALPPLFAVLVNPGAPVETRAVFRELGLAPGETLAGDPHPDPSAAHWRANPLTCLVEGRNDALAALRAAPGCRVARMSGSGATVFGLFEDCRGAVAGAASLHRPGWWVKATVLR